MARVEVLVDLVSEFPLKGAFGFLIPRGRVSGYKPVTRSFPRLKYLPWQGVCQTKRDKDRDLRLQPVRQFASCTLNALPGIEEFHTSTKRSKAEQVVNKVAPALLPFFKR
ncbi:MAG: hypothetical protein JWO94_2011 [Verrucomicrobiaceae bacterium]|nr:hypothetical protein [Verrucomicrobiaceae bacterium]